MQICILKVKIFRTENNENFEALLLLAMCFSFSKTFPENYILKYIPFCYVKAHTWAQSNITSLYSPWTKNLMSKVNNLRHQKVHQSFKYYSSVLKNRPVTLGPDSLLSFFLYKRVSRESGPNVTGLLLNTPEYLKYQFQGMKIPQHPFKGINK